MTSPTNPDKRVGVREVARAAGVSTQTVSRVINEHPQVREETRLKVLAAMADLGYRMNSAARALGTARSRMIGVIASDAALFGPSTGIAALERAAREAGRWILTSYVDAADDAAVDAAVEHLLAQGVDSLVMVGSRVRTTARLQAASLGVPVASLVSETGGQREAAALAVEHLRGLGHARIARLGGPDGWAEESARRAGFFDGLDDTPATGEWRGDWSASSGHDRAASIAAAVQAGELTAVVVANDQMALGLMAGLAAHGISVPHDVSVVGFDDNPDAAFYRPALTTVKVDILAEARAAVADVLDDDTVPTSATGRLIVRESASAPA